MTKYRLLPMIFLYLVNVFRTDIFAADEPAPEGNKKGGQSLSACVGAWAVGGFRDRALPKQSALLPDSIPGRHYTGDGISII
jgi:hypothetical protein